MLSVSRSWYVALAAACALLALSACGGAGRTSDEVRGALPKQVSVSWATKPATLDPDLIVSPVDIDAMHLIGGTLYELRVGGDGGTISAPGLASGMSISADGLTQTYTLRPGLKFSDGEPLTSEDVVATFDRALHDKANAYAGLLAPVASVASYGAHAIVFKLRHPYPSWSHVLGEPEFSILPATKLEAAKGTAKGNFFRHPISAGPYMLDASTTAGSLNETFVANPSYWGPKATIPRVTFITISDISAALNELRAGQVDMVTLVPPALFPALAQAPGIRMTTRSQYGFNVILMNDQKAPLNDVRVRQAISLAVDRPRLVQDVFYGKVRPLSGFWPSTMSGYDPNIPVTPDLTKARTLLAGTACAHGCSIPMIYETTDTSWTAQAAPVLQQDLKAIGINVELVHEDEATLLSAVSSGNYVSGLLALYQLQNLPDVMIANGLEKNGGFDSLFSGYNSPEMNGLAAQAIESAGGARAQAEKEINTQFAKDQPYVTLTDSPMFYASRLPEQVLSMGTSTFLRIGGR